MIDLSSWMDTFLQALNAAFTDRIWFVGLQGSYARGEATETSDIDVVVILDELSVSDIQAYHTMLDTLLNRELICGFLSGKNEILHWEPFDLFQFYYDTKPIKGNLDDLLPLLDREVIKRSIKVGACNLYHSVIHNMLYDKSDEILSGLYKSASFIVQAINFLETGNYTRYLKDLLLFVNSDERKIIDTFIRLKNGAKVEFQPMSENLFTWSKKWIADII